MNALRLIYDKPPETIRLPEEYRHGSVEVIIMPISRSPSREYEIREIANPSWLAEFAGSWKGSCLAREQQGKYEKREALK